MPTTPNTVNPLLTPALRKLGIERVCILDLPPVERWLAVVDFPAYEVSDHGRVRRVAPDTRGGGGGVGRMLAGGFNARGKGYRHVLLYANGKRKTCPVHRLVAVAFLGPPPAGKNEAAHTDGDSRNNHATNLRWASRAENAADMQGHGTSARGERQNKAKLTAADVRAIRADTRSPKLIAEDYAVGANNISEVKRNKTWKHIV